jgi:hypothetical protein
MRSLVLIKHMKTEPPPWGTQAWDIKSDRGTLFLFGYTDLSLISNEIYLFLDLMQPPTKSELRALRLLFWKWAEGSTAVISVSERKSERFAEFFGFADSGNRSIDGKLFVGVF